MSAIILATVLPLFILIGVVMQQRRSQVIRSKTPQAWVWADWTPCPAKAENTHGSSAVSDKT